MKNLNSLMVLFFLSLCVLFTACTSGTKSDTATSEAADEAVDEATEAVAEKINLANATIDLENSKVAWKGEMLGVYAHEGTVKFSEGTVTVSEDAITSGTFVVDMSSIVPTDENFNPDEGKTPEKLVGHLSSNDFFRRGGKPDRYFYY